MRIKLLLAAALAAVAAAAAANVLHAHSRPIRFDPSPGQVLEQAPASVTGWFTAELRRDPNWTFLQVRDAQGNRVDVGETQLSANRKQLTVSLRTGLAAGRYQVTWRGFDDGDGAILGDCFYFYVGQAAADQAIAAGIRDGGRDCARIDVDATNGTPVAGGTPQATAAVESGGEGNHGGDGKAEEEDSDGVPAWTLVLAGALGLVIGGAGVKLLGSRG